jgi:pilus assembly protein CpaF
MMVGMGNPNISLHSIRQQIASAIDAYIQVSRLSDGSRKITQIAETIGLREGEVELRQLFEFEKLGVRADGRVEGRFQATGERPSFLNKLQRSGLDVPDSVFELSVEV